MATETMTALKSADAKINYFPPDGPKVFYPGTAGYQRRNFDTKTVPIKDIRGSEDDFKLDKNGFQLVKNKWTEVDAEDTSEHIKATVYPEITDMLKKVTGASDVLIFSHLLRCQTAEQVKAMANGLQDSEVLQAAGPTTFAHCDNSKKGALPVLKDNISASDAEKRTKSRWAIMNASVWRPFGRPATREPLAMLDSQTLREDDLVGVFSQFQKTGKGAFAGAYDASEGFETAQIKANNDHQWYYISNMTPEETWVFKQYDSKLDGRARQTAHCAIQCPDDHGPPRQSIEARCLVFWEGESAD